MPRDLFAEAGINPNAQQSAAPAAPRDLFAETGVTSPTQQQGLIPRIASDIDVGAANMGANILKHIPGIGQYFQNQDYATFYGAPQQPNVLDKVVQGVAQYAPYGALAELAPNLAGQAAVGALYGATQSDHPIAGAIAGAGGNLLGAGIPLGIGAVAKGTKNYLTQYAAPGLASRVSGIFDVAKNFTNEQAFNQAQSNYGAWKDAANMAWENVRQKAPMVDAAGYSFDNSNYINNVQNLKDNIISQIKGQPFLQDQYQPSLDLLDRVLGSQHGTFADALAHRQALNTKFGGLVNATDPTTLNTLKQVQAAFHNTINSNVNSDVRNIFGNDWQNANNLTRTIKTTFENTITPQGKAQKSAFLGLNNQASPFTDPTSFANKYIPKASEDGTQKMQQLTAMLGDSDLARSVLKNNIFANAVNTENNTVTPSIFLKKYNQLSQPQKDYLFSNQDQNQINALGKVLDKYPNAINSKGGVVSHGLMKLLLSTGGALGGYSHGGLGGAAIGIMGGTAIPSTLSYAMTKEPAINWATRYLTSAPTQSTASPLMTKALQNLLTPSAVNLVGGQ